MTPPHRSLAPAITDDQVLSIDCHPAMIPPILTPFVRPAQQFLAVAQNYLAPAWDLAVRVWMGLVFFRSGLEKAKDWDATVFLFQEEYQLPLLPPEFAAALGMSTEIAMPIFLFLGLAARLAAAPLIVMTCVIQFVLGASMPAYNSVEHFYWLFLLFSIVLRGPGRFSLDHAILQRMGAQSP